jgi:chromosome segregation ATPase
MSDQSSGIRKDDIQIDKLIKDVGRLEADVTHIKEMINVINDQINMEKEDHFYIKGRVEYVKEKLAQMETAITELGISGDRRADKVEELQRDMTSLIETINKVNGILDKLNSGPHAAVHRWAESQMVVEEEKQILRKKLTEALLTRTATAILLVILFLIGQGIIQYYETVTEPEVHILQPAPTPQ